MSGVRVAMPKHAHRCTGIRTGLINLTANVKRRKRHVRRGNHLRRGQQVRFEVVRLRTEQIARATQARNHFVRDEKDFVLLQNRLDFFEVCGRGHDHTACTLDGFCDEAADGFRAFGQDERFKLFGQARRKLLRRFAIFRELIRMRAPHTQHAVNGQIKVLMHRWNAGQRRRRDRHAVIALAARNDLFLERLANCIVVVPHELKRRIVGLRARVCEDHTPLT